MASAGKLGRFWVGLVLLAGVTVNPLHAMARESAGGGALPPVTRWDARPFSGAVQVGLASPGGLVGVELEYAMQRWLVLGAGAGPTFSGGQAGAWLAPRWTFTSVAVGLDLGASVGPYREWAIMDEHGPWVRYETAGWFNAAARLQYLSRRGFSFRAFLGVTTLLNPAAGRCNTGSEDIPCRRRKLLYGGLAFGYAFGLKEALRRPAR